MSLLRYVDPDPRWLCRTPASPAVGDRFQCSGCGAKFVAVKRGRPVWELFENPGACPHTDVEPEAVGPVVVGPLILESAHACACGEWVVPYVEPEAV